AKPAQPSKALFNIKETRLLHLPPSPINAEEMESHRTAQSQGFFEPSRWQLRWLMLLYLDKLLCIR
ncbi:hypothetical protein, partial [Komagataeibacter rhaeticus]|uniref:hypothetical protein n=1 Tax=Komagataeibacter rhaeticus TaxID=215221 RepID=UPI00241DB351